MTAHTAAATKRKEAVRANVMSDDAVYMPTTSVARKAVGVELLYLTTQQYQLLYTVRFYCGSG